MTEPDPTSHALGLVDFVNAASSPYHAVSSLAGRLESQGFRRLDERDEWHLEAGECAFLVRGGGTLMAWRVGTEPASQAGFVMLGAHTDSPNLRLKPRPELVSGGWSQLGVEVYGGALFYTWLDRDLAVAGRVALREGRTELVRIDRPLLRIPSLAVHLQRAVNSKGLLLDPQKHLVPLLGREGQGLRLRELLARELASATRQEVVPSSIEAWDLCLYDLQPAVLGGIDADLVSGGRLDDLVSCHAATDALLGARPRAATQVVILVDHEEVGSETAHGAKSRFILAALERIQAALGDDRPQALSRALARSLLVSSDMAHAVHPNYSDKHDPQHALMVNQGPAIKLNAGQSYATDAPAQAAFLEACRTVQVPSQLFVSRNDLRCGSTMGPVTAARLGVRSVDVGNPMLAMHSCRELGGALDVGYLTRALTEVLGRTPLPPPDA